MFVELVLPKSFPGRGGKFAEVAGIHGLVGLGSVAGWFVVVETTCVVV